MSSKQDLVGIDVADTGNNALIMQHLFDWLFALCQFALQIICRQSRIIRLDAKLIKTGESILFISAYVPESAEAPLILIPKLVSIRQIQDQMCVWPAGNPLV